MAGLRVKGNFILLWVAAGLIFAVGCQVKQTREQAAEPHEHRGLTKSLASLSMPRYLDDAFEATGGTLAWTATEAIYADAAVTFYRPEAAEYLTGHFYSIDPQAGRITITANEPGGKINWSFRAGDLKGKTSDITSYSISARLLAESLLNIITAPVRAAEQINEISIEKKAVKLQGRWYYPVFDASLVYYKSLLTGRFEIVKLADQQGKSYSVRGYDYTSVAARGPLLPRKIEIFLTDAQGNFKERLAKIDIAHYKRIFADHAD